MSRSPPPLTVNENLSCDRSCPFGRYERKCLLHIRRGHVTRLIITSPLINISYNIARVLALYKSYLAAMNKIFIYTRPCVNKMTWAFLLPGFRVSAAAITVRQNNSVVVAQEKTASFLQSVFSNCTVHGSVNIILTNQNSLNS